MGRGTSTWAVAPPWPKPVPRRANFGGPARAAARPADPATRHGIRAVRWIRGCRGRKERGLVWSAPRLGNVTLRWARAAWSRRSPAGRRLQGPISPRVPAAAHWNARPTARAHPSRPRPLAVTRTISPAVRAVALLVPSWTEMHGLLHNFICWHHRKTSCELNQPRVARNKAVQIPLRK